MNQDEATILGRRWAHNITDPFSNVPQDIMVHILQYLSCVDTFRCRVASLYFNATSIPQKEYRRYIREEMAYLPVLILQLDEHEDSEKGSYVDWRSIFEHVSRAWQRDSGLRNRRRIWKIVQPMADELVERSCCHLWAAEGLGPELSKAITVVRGNVGVRLSDQGYRETIILSEMLKSIFSLDVEEGSSETPQSTSTERQIAFQNSAFQSERPFYHSHDLMKIDIWLHPEEGFVCGLNFVFSRDKYWYDIGSVSKIIGRRTTVCKTLSVDQGNHILTGFTLCWTQACVGGIQFHFEDPSNGPSETREGEILSERFGIWSGPVRRLVAPRKYRIFAGITAFINTAGRMETFALLEKKKPVKSQSVFQFLSPPNTVPLSHGEASLWTEPPPNDVEILERLGPYITDWRTRTAECEVFGRTSLSEPAGAISEIMQFSSDDHLVGIRFVYKKHDGTVLERVMGLCDGEPMPLISFTADEDVTLAVVSHGRTGIHSLQVSFNLFFENNC